MAENKKQRKNEIVLSQEKEKQQCQESKVAEQQHSEEKKKQKQPADEPKKSEKDKSLYFLGAFAGTMIILIVTFKVISYWEDLTYKAGQYEEYAAENKELREQKGQLEDEIREQEQQFLEEKDILEKAERNLTYFLEFNDKIQEVSYTKLDGERVLFVNIPISEDSMLRDEYEIYDNNNVPIYLKFSESEEIAENTKLYVHFSGMEENWTVENVSGISGDVYYFPYRDGNNTYYCWKLPTYKNRYCVEFNPHNGDDPYYLILWA